MGGGDTLKDKGLYFDGNSNLICTGLSNTLKNAKFTRLTVIIRFRFINIRSDANNNENLFLDFKLPSKSKRFRCGIIYINYPGWFHPFMEIDYQNSGSRYEISMEYGTPKPGYVNWYYITDPTIYKDKPVYEFQYSPDTPFYYNGEKKTQPANNYNGTPQMNMNYYNIFRIGGYKGYFNDTINGYLYNLRIYNGIYHTHNYNKETPYYQVSYNNIKFK